MERKIPSANAMTWHSAVVWLNDQFPSILGVPSPVFPGILLSKKHKKPKEIGRFRKERLVKRMENQTLDFWIGGLVVKEGFSHQPSTKARVQIPKSPTPSWFRSDGSGSLQGVCKDVGE